MDIRTAQQELAAALTELIEEVGAANAFVFDAWGLIWCSAHLTHGSDQRRLYEEVKFILESLSRPLEKGGKLDRVFPHGGAPTYCTSFAATYVLAVWLDAGTNEFLLRRRVREALPRIEAMTLALPPPDGSDPTSAAGHA